MAANEARKLTPEQKIEKIKNKMQKDVSVNGTNVAVFRYFLFFFFFSFSLHSLI